MAWWWQRRKDRETRLLQALLEAEATRASAAAQVEQQKISLESRRLELEYEHLEASHEERRKDRIAAEELRQKRRQWSSEAKARQKLKAAGGVPTVPNGLDPANCPVCRNPGDPRLTADEIKRHHAHLAAVASQRTA